MKKQKKSKSVHDFHDEELINSFNEVLGVNTDDCLLLNQQLFQEEYLVTDDILLAKSVSSNKIGKEKRYRS